MLIDSVIKLLIYISLIFTIGFSLLGFYSVYYDYNKVEFIFLYEKRKILEQIILGVYGFLCSICVFFIYFSTQKKHIKIYIPQFLIIILLSFIVFISLAKSGFSFLRPMVYLGLLMTFFLYDTYPKLLKYNYVVGTYSKIYWNVMVVLIVFLLVPFFVHIFHFLITNQNYFNIPFAPQLYIYDSFRGLTVDRNQYGFLAGLLILLLSYSDNIKYRKIYIIFTIIALGYTVSRASIVALFLAFLFKYGRNISIKMIGFLFLSISFLIILILFSERTFIFQDGGNRLGILSDCIKFIFKDGFFSFMTGIGNLYTSTKHSNQPDNLILQTIMDFGFFAAILWLWLLYRFFRCLNKSAQSVFIFVFLYGFFHVGFSLLVFMPYTVFSYMIVILVNNKEVTYDNTGSQKLLEAANRKK